MDDERSTWQIGIPRRRGPRLEPVTPWNLPDMRRCEASLSADSYKRHTPKADFDEAKWQWMDAGHERCPHPTKMMFRSTEKWFGVCGRHAHIARTTGAYYPYLQPGPACPHPCCADQREGSR